MMAIFKIVQGLLSSIMSSAGISATTNAVMPAEIINAIESCSFFESIPLWAITIIRWIISYSIIFCDDTNGLW